MTLNALALVCTLKKSPAPSSSEHLAVEVLEALAEHGATTELIRVVDRDVAFGTSTDEGNGDGWPSIRERVLAADVVVLATPIWMGQPASVAKMTLERLDAELSETDDAGRPTMYDKVALVAVVGNEDGAHRVVADTLQALNDVGFTVPAAAGTYWVGEAMGSTDYKDLPGTPEAVASTTRTAAANAVHLAHLLRGAAYPKN
ncbi:MAG: flavodoxin family protein [Sporichthyaceae bacterium]